MKCKLCEKDMELITRDSIDGVYELYYHCFKCNIDAIEELRFGKISKRVWYTLPTSIEEIYGGSDE